MRGGNGKGESEKRKERRGKLRREKRDVNIYEFT